VSKTGNLGDVSSSLWQQQKSVQQPTHYLFALDGLEYVNLM